VLSADSDAAHLEGELVAHYHAGPLRERNPWWRSGRESDALDAKRERRIPTFGITPRGFEPAKNFDEQSNG
jgi:hypothetical protein